MKALQQAPAEELGNGEYLGLRPRAEKIICEAIESGVISIDALINLLPKTAKQRQRTSIIKWWIGFLELVNVRVEDPNNVITARRPMRSTGPKTATASVFENARRGGINDEGILAMYAQEMRPFERLSREELCALAERFQKDGDITVRNKIVVHNWRLSLWMARQYAGKGLDLLDLIQEGNIGLMTAAERFDPQRGFAFGTYAGFWVRQKITRAIQNYSRTIRISVHLLQKYNRVMRTYAVLAQKFGRGATREEVANALSVTSQEVAEILRPMSVHRTISIDGPDGSGNSYKGGDGRPYMEVLPDPSALNPELISAGRQEVSVISQNISKLLAVLSAQLANDTEKQDLIRARNETIFRMRYGLDGSLEKKTLEEVAQKFDVTRERIRQIVDKQWKRLRRRFGADINEEWLEGQVKRLVELENLTGEVAKLL